MGNNKIVFSFIPLSSTRTRIPITLSHEIIQDILKRLPVKSLIRFSSVSKHWFNLFRTPKFISHHLLHHAHNTPLLVVERFFWDHKNSSGLDYFLLQIRNQKLQELNIPNVTDSDMGFKIVGSCNGLICVCNYSSDPSSAIFLWNPATRQIRRIPEQSNALLSHKVSPYCLLGVCYNATVDDYEVVRVHSADFDSGLSLNGARTIRVEKYSLRSGLWKEVVYSNFNHGVTLNGALFWVENFVAVKGLMYWIAMEVKERSSAEFIVSFNTENNVLRKISLPHSVNPEVYKKLAVYKDSLAVLICSELETMEHYLELWVLDDECNGLDRWIKEQTIGFFSRSDRPMGLWKNEVLMASSEVIHSINGFKAPVLSGELGDGCSYNVFNYAESLVCVYGGNGKKIDEEDEDESSKIVEDSLYDMFFSKMRILFGLHHLVTRHHTSANMNSGRLELTPTKFYYTQDEN